MNSTDKSLLPVPVTHAPYPAPSEDTLIVATAASIHESDHGTGWVVVHGDKLLNITGRERYHRRELVGPNNRIDALELHAIADGLHEAINKMRSHGHSRILVLTENLFAARTTHQDALDVHPFERSALPLSLGHKRVREAIAEAGKVGMTVEVLLIQGNGDSPWNLIAHEQAALGRELYQGE